MTVATQFEILGALREMETDALYAACRVNGMGRATDQAMAARYEALRRIVASIQPCTVRQVFYQAEVHGIVDKTEEGYEKIQRALVALRERGVVPFRHITDNTRWQMKPASYDSLSEMLEASARLYRRTVWSEAPVYCEVWLEKDALAGVVHPVTEIYDVGLMVARGFSSLSFLYSAAADIRALDKPAHIYHLGDHDPSGRLAAQSIEQRLRSFAPDAEIHFEHLAVLPEQVAEWSLPTRPTKRSTHSKGWRGKSVELDAVNPHVLRELVRTAIEQHLPDNLLEHLHTIEESEREQLRMFATETWEPTP